MANWIKAQILRMMLVPSEPHPPAGSPGSIQVFHAGRNYLKWRLFIWAIANFFAFCGIAIAYVSLSLGIRRAPEWAQLTWQGWEILSFTAFLASLPFTYMQQKLNYELRWYMVTDRSLRIRSGIWSVQELTTTFANIQEVRVMSGPLQKVLGLADVAVFSAGGGGGGSTAHGGGGGGAHVARFDGVENASEIRDLIIDRLRRYRDSGLGEVAHAPDVTVDPDAIAAARTVLDEVRALRASLGTG